LDKSVVPEKWFSSNAIKSNFKSLIWKIVSSLIYFCNNCFDIINILYGVLISIVLINFELEILCILNSEKSLNFLNKSSVNCVIVSVGAGVIINTFNLSYFNLRIKPPTIYVFPDLHLHPHKNDLLPLLIKSTVLLVINSWWNLNLSDKFSFCVKYKS